MLLFNVRPSRR